MPATLAVDGVSRRYGSFLALDRVSLSVAPGEIVCLLGPSGSGKSTLLRLIAGVERPDGGTIAIDGREVAGPRGFVEPEQRLVGMVFQDYALFPHLTIAANVAFGLNGGRRGDHDGAVASLLARVGLTRYARSYPHMLSGGERQRAALARALAPAPRLLLMDEPFSSLDGHLRDQVRQDTLALLRETGTTTLVVTHDPQEAMRIADRVALMHHGRIVQSGPPAAVYARPATVAAARLFGDVNEMRGTCLNGRIHTPLGVFDACGLAEGARACVCVRPQHLRLGTGGASAKAHVTSLAFVGDGELVGLAMSGIDLPLSLRTYGRTGLSVGDVVDLDVRPDDAMVVPG